MLDRTKRNSPDNRRFTEYRGVDARSDADTGTFDGYLSNFWRPK